MEACEPAEPGGGWGVFVVGFGLEEAEGGDEEDGPEDVLDEVKAGEQGEAAGDEGSAHDDGAGDTPEEDLGLADGRDAEEAEEKEEDEEVVDGEGLLDGVAGKVLDGAGAAVVRAKDEGESEGGGGPERGGPEGFAVGVGEELVQAELRDHEDEDREVEVEPVGGGRHWMHFMGCIETVLTAVGGAGGPEGPGDEGGLEEEACKALVVGVEAEGVAALAVLGDVAGEDGGEEAGGGAAYELACFFGGADERGAESDFTNAGGEDDLVGFDGEPGRDLGFEGFARDGEVRDAGKGEGGSEEVACGALGFGFFGLRELAQEHWWPLGW